MVEPDATGDSTTILEPKQFWNKRYDDGSAPDEWYCDNEVLEPVLRWAFRQAPEKLGERKIANLTGSVAGTVMLNIGCGRSELCTQLAFGAGLTDSVYVAALDVSLPALHSREVGPMALLAADVIAMPFRDATFDIVVDKGTLDYVLLSLLVAEDRDVRLASLRKELLRVIRPGGRLVVITGLGGTSEDPKHFLTEADSHDDGPSEIVWSNIATRYIKRMARNYRCHCFIRSRHGGMM